MLLSCTLLACTVSKLDISVYPDFIVLHCVAYLKLYVFQAKSILL